ncbi:MAG: type I-E CRISPR-associated protein Cas7/Cse4/CasC [Methyloceanibacter sp.]|nr:MAG: type I-E CRISPR-associated protein Cas7/Cse4/CasC [Methyloceanibacter sp.]
MNAKTVELHLLQSFPPSCVNRDGNNSPKDCTFGDARRARISSQCLKRAVRQSEAFAQTVGEAIAVRSKQMRDKKLVPYLTKGGLAPQEAEKLADDFRSELAKDDSKRKNLTSVGLYFGDDELFSLLESFRRKEKDWKGKGKRKSADVALFGRMLAEATDLNVDAAAQMAHAISTHKLSQEMDYWTAADDLKDQSEGEDAGAGMLGTAEFNASVFYRYASVNLDQLGRNLGEKSEKSEWVNEPELTRKTINAFLLASYDAVPTGKLNGHAHFNPPFVALAAVRTKGMPLNLCNAFLDPVRARIGRDIGAASADALLAHLKRMRAMVPVDDASYILAHALPEAPATDRLLLVGGYAALVDEVMGALK